MEDFPLLILFFMIYLFAGVSGNKKSKKKSRSGERRSPMRSRSQGEQYDSRALMQDRQTREGFQNAFADVSLAAQPCEQQRMHLHEVSSEQMQKAAEGEDPCHLGDARMARAQQGEPEAQEETREQLEQDILRGVIMSEILTRPCERMAMRRGRR